MCVRFCSRDLCCLLLLRQSSLSQKQKVQNSTPALSIRDGFGFTQHRRRNCSIQPPDTLLLRDQHSHAPLRHRHQSLRLLRLHFLAPTPPNPQSLLQPLSHLSPSLCHPQRDRFLSEQVHHLEKQSLSHQSLDLSFTPNSSNELKLFLLRHKLPLGKDSKTGLTEMVASVGHSCKKSVDLLSQFMSYKVSGPCPDDWSLAQKLILQGCEPLPKRRCFAKRVPKVGLLNFSDSLWNPVNNKSKILSGFDYNKKLGRDCVGCFDLVNEFETRKYVKARSKNDFLIDEVLGIGAGGIRIGFDIGGGSGTYAARMAERNVTVITNTLNVDAAYIEFIAARGLFPLYLSLNHRFPFYDNVFDLIHCSMSLEIGDEAEKLEFLMFDVDRVLRPGGLIWFDNLTCASDKKKELSGLIEMFGYRKLKWVVGEKDGAAGSGKSVVLLSAILQKPVRV